MGVEWLSQCVESCKDKLVVDEEVGGGAGAEPVCERAGEKGGGGGGEGAGLRELLLFLLVSNLRYDAGVALSAYLV